MMASLYQSASPVPVDASRVVRGPRTATRPCWLEEIVEVPLGAQPATHAEHVGGQHGRVERDEAARTVPEVARVAQQVVHLERLARVESERVERKVDPSA